MKIDGYFQESIGAFNLDNSRCCGRLACYEDSVDWTLPQGDGAGGAVRLHSVTPGIEGAPKPRCATYPRLLLLQQGGRTDTRIEADRV
jgi:hypothetical protein